MCHLLYLGGLVFSDASKLFGISADSVPVISCVISAFVTAVFWATSFAAGLLTVSTASLLSAKAFSRPSTSLISDPARNLFRIACHIQVFALSRWLHCQLSTMNLLRVYYGVFPTSISLGKLGTSSQSWWDQAPLPIERYAVGFGISSAAVLALIPLSWNHSWEASSIQGSPPGRPAISLKIPKDLSYRSCSEIYYTLLEFVKRICLGIVAGAYMNNWSSKSTTIILLSTTSFQLFFLVLKKPFIKKRVQLVEFILVASCFVLLEKEFSAGAESKNGIFMVLLFLVAFFALMTNECGGGETLETSSSAGRSRSSGSRSSGTADKPWLKQLRELAKSSFSTEGSGTPNDPSSSRTKWSGFWNRNRSGISSKNSSSDSSQNQKDCTKT
ncbi:hypothetical protein Q3G72_025547 [Acer saccharum]|nr:hypothetical protein Q3G72_025547 [Acer saccharum]